MNCRISSIAASLFSVLKCYCSHCHSGKHVITRLHHKLEYRHPHLFPRPDFDPGEISTSDDVVRNWELIKAAERASRLAAGSLPGPGTGLSSGL